MNLPGQINQINTNLLQTQLSGYRIIGQEDIKRIKASIESLGMLHPILVGRLEKDYEIIDGFKRFYASIELGYKKINSRVIDVTLSEGKALIISSNKHSSSTVDYEEAAIVYSLRKEDGLSGQEISVLLGQSTSWVSRRLSLITKLDSKVKEQIKMSLLSHSHAREIVKLPRGNQQQLSESIIKNNLTVRESGLIAEAFKGAKDKAEQDYILNHPKKIITNLTTEDGPSYDHRLSKQGNKILRTLEILHRQQCILISQLSGSLLKELEEYDIRIIHPRLGQVAKRSNQIIELIHQYKNK